MFKIILLSFSIFFGFTSSSFAYLDPGSVNLILQFFAIILTFVVTCWLFIKNFFKKLFNKIFKKKDKINN